MYFNNPNNDNNVTTGRAESCTHSNGRRVA